jgi:hypothetical protein
VDALCDDFIWVVADTAERAFRRRVVRLALQRLDPRGWRSRYWRASQASGFALHQRFNHNDLYHVLQIAAMFLFYRGVRAYATDGRTPSP